MVDHASQQRVATAGHEAEERGLERRRSEKAGGDVAVKMIDRGERQLLGGGQRLGVGDSDQQRPHQARAARDRDQLDLGQSGPGAA